MNRITLALSLLFTLATFLSCRSQSRTDMILSKTVDSLNATDINLLIKNGYIPNADGPIIGTYMVAIAQHNNTKNWTVKQLLDSVKARMQKGNDATAVRYHYGKDSVFIGFPNGKKMFIGMGELSFEKMIAKASLNLPLSYDGDYDLRINSSEAIKKLSLLISNSEYPPVIGNVLLYERDSGQLKNMKIGDIFEISKRMVSSKEFAPFVSLIK